MEDKVQLKDNRVRVKRKENHLKKDVLPTIEKNLKRTEIICLQLIAKVIKEVIQEADPPVSRINLQINSNSNTCRSSLMQLILILLPMVNKIRILDKTVFHLVTMVLVDNSLRRFILLLKSSSS